MNKYPNHSEHLIALRRIEGQIRGIQKMIQDGEYCVDIITQMQAVRSALARVEDFVLEKHLEGCVTNAIEGKSVVEKKKKLSEVIQLIKRSRKT